MQKKTSTRNRLTLGFLSFYQNQMMRGVFKAAQKYDVNIIGFSCSYNVELDKFEQELKMLFDLIKQQHLDGLLFLGWMKIVGVNYEEFRDNFGSLPIYSLGTGYPDIPHSMMEGSGYFKELLIHLIENHRCRRIALIPGIIRDDRYGVYCDVMKEYGIFDPSLIADDPDINKPGLDFTLRGQKALSILLDRRKAAFDAVASTYNYEAVSVINELKRRGFSVPDDVKVIGYEDKDQGRYSSPPLTTIYYPFWELGYFGCERFVQRLRDPEGSVPFSSSIPGKIILRGSCGCVSDAVKIAGEKLSDRTGVTLFSGEPEKEERRALCEELKRLLPYAKFDIQELVDTFFRSFKTEGETSFRTALEKSLLDHLQFHSDISDIENVISYLRKSILSSLTGREEEIRRAENILHAARVAVAEKTNNLLGNRKIREDIYGQLLEETSQELIATFNAEKLMDILALRLPALDLPSCFLFLFDEGKTSFNDCFLTFRYVDKKRIAVNTAIPTTARDLPEKIFPPDRQYNLMAHLLHRDQEHFGLVFFEPGPIDEQVYISLAVQLTTALHGAALLKRLKKTNQELIATQKELVDKAHKAGMADIATGTLHNVGNVLNSINISVQLLQEISNESPLTDLLQANTLLEANIGNIEEFIRENPKGKKLMRYYIELTAPLAEFEKQIHYHIKRLREKTEMVNDIISAQQDYAGAKSIVEKMSLETVIEDALKIQSSSLEKYNIAVEKNFAGADKILVNKTKLLHILLNLFNNAKDAMQETAERKRKIVLTIDRNGRSTRLRITDTGSGIPRDLLEQIFTNGFTTKKNGHGFGLHTAANYMTEMGGKIWAESDGRGKGATFILQFAQSS